MISLKCMQFPTLQVDLTKLMDELHQLATYSECQNPPPAVTRVVFSDADLQAREYLASLYCSAGLQVRVDAAGNTFARWEGTQPHLPAVATGSHTDAIPYAGMYDGTVGVLGGLEAIRALRRSGFRPQRSIELLMFTSEEPTRFGIGCSGSRLMSGALSAEQAARLKDDEDVTFEQVRLHAGFSGGLSSVLIPAGTYSAFVELHIEQGPLLEKSGASIGVVTEIAAPATALFEVIGEGGHAGAVLMPSRHDALVAAAELVMAIERCALESQSADTVATVGKMAVHPGAVNSIPSQVKFTLDLRDIDGENRDQVFQAISEASLRIASERRVEVKQQLINSDPPASCDRFIVDIIEAAAAKLGLQSQLMVSRAYHDSLFMARLAPTGMIFIPCRNGVSHRPDEYTAPEQIEAGVAILAMTLAKLSATTV